MRTNHRLTRAGLLGLLVLGALTFWVAPSGATIVCPAGTTDLNYCFDFVPTATTRSATNVKSTSATLNGTTGPTIANGDTVSYLFLFGRSTGYGQYTPTRTVGYCPPGKSGTSFCSSPATTDVAATIKGLVPCTTYHFQIVAQNSDGRSQGIDKKLKTTFQKPISELGVPRAVSRGKTFKITIRLKSASHLKVQIRRRGRTLRTYYDGGASGTVVQTARITGVAGDYSVSVVAGQACGSQTVTKTVRVRRPI